MNEAAAKKPRWYSRVLPSTFEGRVALVTALLLLTTVIVVWIVRWLGRENVPLRHAMTTGRFLVEFGLAIIIPVVMYWGIRWWSRVEQEVFPDIDRAWRAGIDALYMNGLSLDALPVFLVLGSPDPEFENEMMAAALSNPRIEGVPPELTVRHALRWYASSDAVYLFCTNTCSLSALASSWRDHGPPRPVTPGEREEIAPPVRQRESPASTPHEYLDTLQPQEDVAELDGGFDTVSPGLPNGPPKQSAKNAPESKPEPALSSPPKDPYAGTLAAEEIIASVKESTPPVMPRQQAPPSRPTRPTDTLATLPGVDTTQHVERLEYVCQLLRQKRSPRCGINGVLALLPFQLAQASGRDLTNLAHAASQDIDVAQRTLGLRGPVTAMVVGLEREKGFGELIGRLDPGFRVRRLGGRFDLASRPTPVQLNGHSDRVCDAFEEWIYELFRQPDALARHRGNRKLYWLLSRIRHELKPALRTVLGDAFGCEAARTGRGEDDSLFFSGCYFAAIGPTSDDSAFVRGVVEDKMISEQSQVEWNARSRFRHRIFRLLSVLVWVVVVILFALLLYRFLA